MSDQANAGKIFGIKSSVVFGIVFLVIILPAALFIYMSYSRLETVMTTITTQPEMESSSFLKSFQISDPDRYKLQVSVALEKDSIVLRQQRAEVLLATRTWMRFMSLIFGSIMVLVGSVFVLAKVTGPKTEGHLTLKDVGLSFVSSSPGLMIALLGTILIIVPNIAAQDIETSEGSIYFSTSTPVAAPAGQSADPLKEIREKSLKSIIPEYGK